MKAFLISIITTMAISSIAAPPYLLQYDGTNIYYKDTGGTYYSVGVLTNDAIYLVAITNTTEAAGAAFDLSTASHIATLTYPANTVTGLTGDTEFVITGTGHAITGSIGSSITRDTELTTATGACATAWAAADVSATGALYTTVAAGWAASDVLATGACATAWAAADVVLGNLLTNYANALAVLGSNYTDSAVGTSITNIIGAGISSWSGTGRQRTNTVTEAQTLDAVCELGAITDVPTIQMETVVVFRVKGQTTPPDEVHGAVIQLPAQDGSGDVYISPAEGNEVRLLSSCWNQANYTTLGSFYSTWATFDWTAASNLIALGTITEGGTLLSAKYYGIANPSNYVDKAVTNGLEIASHAAATYLPLAGGTMSGAINMGGASITNVDWLYGTPDMMAGSKIDMLNGVWYKCSVGAYSISLDIQNKDLQGDWDVYGTLAVLTNLSVAGTISGAGAVALTSGLAQASAVVPYTGASSAVNLGSQNLTLTGILSNTVTDTIGASFVVTNGMDAWCRVVAGPFPYDLTCTSLDVMQNGASSTVYVVELTNGASIGDAGTAMNSMSAVGTTNSADTSWASATLTAGSRIKLYVDSSKSAYLDGTNDCHATVKYTRPRL